MAPLRSLLTRSLSLLGQFSLFSTYSRPIFQLSNPKPIHEPSGYFNWTAITPHKHLEWHDCYEEHECARLEVPLNWQQDIHDYAVIAITRLPARVSRDDARFGGSILLNPGGPGGSGVDFVRWAGWEIQANIDDEKYFEIVSFDPRGVGHTKPSASCFKNDLDRQALQLQLSTSGHADESSRAFWFRWQAAKAFGEACAETHTKHMTTLDVAHDMIAIIDALDPDLDKPLLNYWGFSYGTYLGNTFASVFPDRIGRMVLDGVVHADDYTATAWSKNLINTEDALNFFYISCTLAGVEKCPMSSQDPYDIQLEMEVLLQSLSMVPFPISHNGIVGTIRYTEIRDMLFQSLYFPGPRWPRLAQQFHDLYYGNVNTIAPSLSRLHTPLSGEDLVGRPPLQKTTMAWENDLLDADYPQFDVSRIIACGDGDPITHRTFYEHESFLKLLQNQSMHFAGVWLDLPTYCVHYPLHLRPDNSSRFRGPFMSKLSDYSKGGSPIMWIGNDVDPVTPLQNARLMAERHEGSVVLEVEQVGHCSGPLNRNLCVYSKLRKFFNDGVVPAEGERVCAGETMPWR